jgi:hypothetical protein
MKLIAQNAEGARPGVAEGLPGARSGEEDKGEEEKSQEAPKGALAAAEHRRLAGGAYETTVVVAGGRVEERGEAREEQNCRNFRAIPLAWRLFHASKAPGRR